MTLEPGFQNGIALGIGVGLVYAWVAGNVKRLLRERQEAREAAEMERVLREVEDQLEQRRQAAQYRDNVRALYDRGD